jgi:Transglycosylase-like domain
VTFVEKISAAGARTVATGRLRRRILAGSLCAALVVALSGGAASADSIGSAQARADRLAAGIAAGAARIRGLEASFYQASDASATAASQLARTQAQLERIQRRVDAGRALLRSQAVTAYVGGPSTATGRAVEDLVVRGEYLRLATGAVTDALDQLRVNAANLRRSEADVRRSQAAAMAAAGRVSHARQAALAEAGRQQAALDQVQGQLAVLLADAQAAQDRQHAAAARAEQLALDASRRPQGPPVNNGLVQAVAAATSGGGAGGVWAQLRQCESGGNYAENTGNGYYGAYQFSQATWTNLGYPGRPDLESPGMQDQAAQKLQAISGWGQWATCAAILGLI